MHLFIKVPMLCIPIDSDQPLVAYRVANELGLGISLDFTTMTENDVCKAVERIFADETYFERAYRYSMISHKHQGHLNGAKLIIEFLNSRITT